MQNQFKLKYHLLTFAMLWVSTMALSQARVHIGVTTGFNSTYVLDKGLNQDPRYVAQTSFKWAPFGGSVGIDFNNRLGLQFESIHAAQGQIYQMIETAESLNNMVAERNIDLQYIQLPLLLKMMSGGTKATRFNFQLGPQLSLLNSGSETIRFVEDAQFRFQEDGEIPADMTYVTVDDRNDIPEEYLNKLESGEIEAFSNNENEVPLEYFENPENPGEYSMPENSIMNLMNSDSPNEVQKFRDKEVQLAFGFGVDVDVLKHFYISANIRGNYSFTDMRNEDLIEFVGDQDLTSVFDNRANLLIGAQIGLHWMIGGNRSYRVKKEAEEAEDTFR